MSDDPDCLGMCAIDDDTCTGCGRTLDQINAARSSEATADISQAMIGRTNNSTTNG